MKTNKHIKIIGIVILVLLILFAIMQFSELYDWSLVDFAIVGGMLFGVALIIDVIWRRFDNKFRILGIIIVAILLLVFLEEMTLGILGTPLASN